MKKLLILLFSILILPLSVIASDVYYCSEDDKTGYVASDNFIHVMFNESKFKIMIDFDNKKVLSDKLYFKSDSLQECFYPFPNKTLYCMNEYGGAFSIDKLTLRFLYADIYNTKSMTNDPRLSHGTCEKF